MGNVLYKICEIPVKRKVTARKPEYMEEAGFSFYVFRFDIEISAEFDGFRYKANNSLFFTTRTTANDMRVAWREAWENLEHDLRAKIKINNYDGIAGVRLQKEVVELKLSGLEARVENFNKVSADFERVWEFARKDEGFRRGLRNYALPIPNRIEAAQYPLEPPRLDACATKQYRTCEDILDELYSITQQLRAIRARG